MQVYFIKEKWHLRSYAQLHCVHMCFYLCHLRCLPYIFLICFWFIAFLWRHFFYMNNLHLSSTLFMFSVAIHNNVLAEKTIVPFIQDVSKPFTTRKHYIESFVTKEESSLDICCQSERMTDTNGRQKEKQRWQKKNFSHQRSTRGPGKMAVATQP